MTKYLPQSAALENQQIIGAFLNINSKKKIFAKMYLCGFSWFKQNSKVCDKHVSLFNNILHFQCSIKRRLITAAKNVRPMKKIIRNL